MGRTVVTAADIAEEARSAESLESIGDESKSSKKERDKYKDRLLKYVPAEVVALYVFLTGMITDASVQGAPQSKALWAVFLFCLVSTPLYLWRVAGVTKRQQTLISTGAFVVWAFSLGGPFDDVVEHRRFYSALALPMYTFLIALIEAEK